MLTARPLQQFICKSCRSKAIATTASRRLDARNRALSTTAKTHFSKRLRPKSPRQRSPRRFSTSSRTLDETSSTTDPPPHTERTPAELEDVARAARNTFRDVLPTDYLDAEEYVVYERLYGAPLKIAPMEELFPEEEEEDDEPIGPIENSLFIEDEKGNLKQVTYYVGGKRETPEAAEDGEDVVHEGLESEEMDEEEPVEEEGEVQEEIDDYWPGDERLRAHPLTVAGKFATFPTMLTLPKTTFVEPVAKILSLAANKHLRASAELIFGGHRFPHSTATPLPPGGGLEQKPIPLSPAQGRMSPMESNSYIAAVMPGTYASVMSILVEVRKRLGSAWLASLLEKEGGPLILDAGSAGAGVVAVREVLRAEWERLEEEAGTLKDERKPAPLGKATVLTGSDCLRHRVSQLLENTSFIPRLPDAIVPGENVGPNQRKVYDIIIAPHTLWSLKEDYLRKAQVQKYWSLLNPNGGVLVIMEKGLPRGFEVVAGARALLLDNYISSPGSEQFETALQDPHNKSRYTQKETGMIVAPCTNHSACPMLVVPGVSRHRKDFCYFRQSFIRPPFLQNLINARGNRNYEDVQFSYVAVQRGHDLRAGEHGVEQGESGANRAFEGYGQEENEAVEPEDVEAEDVDAGKDDAPTEPELEEVPHAEPTTASSAAPVSTLSFPRLILPAIKRRGHVLLDVCTPAGKLERWTVTKSRGKRAFRDARKAQWGDLWALGAKTRVARNVRLGQLEGRGFEKGKKAKGGVDGHGRSVKRGRESRREERIRRIAEREAGIFSS